MSLISAVKLKFPGAEFDGKAIEQLQKHYSEATHPETPYLNPYEEAFKSWVKKTLGKKQRLIVFIDDLDRCMPEIALQVLEALKLYLNVPGLVFVMGLDPDVIHQVVYKHYEKFHSQLQNENQSKDNPTAPQLKPEDYLAKMFQIEVQLTRSHTQIEKYFEDLTEEFKPWQQLPKDDRKIFKTIILNKAPDNPREIKRLINNALITAIGYESIPKDKTNKTESLFSRSQGVQLFFVFKILKEDHDIPNIFKYTNLTEFLYQWSQIVREGKETDENFPLTISVPIDYSKEFEQSRTIKQGDFDKVEKQMLKQGRLERPSFAPEPYHDLIKTNKYVLFFPLLADENLGHLIQIKFPTKDEMSMVSQVAESLSDEDIISEAIAKQLGIKDSEITSDQLYKLSELDLSGKKITDLNTLQILINLQILYLHNTQVTDLTSLQNLTNLQSLHLDNIQVTDLSPLQNLTNLSTLDLTATLVTDFTPLRNLTKLEKLYLNNTQISDLTPLQNLTNLQDLYLNKTQVADLTPLQNLTNLQDLEFANTLVTNLTPMQNLINLQDLFLAGA